MTQPEPAVHGYTEPEIVAAEEQFDALINAGITAAVAAAVAAILAEPIVSTVTDAIFAPIFTLWNTYTAEVLIPELTRVYLGSGEMFLDTLAGQQVIDRLLESVEDPVRREEIENLLIRAETPVEAEEMEQRPPPSTESREPSETPRPDVPPAAEPAPESRRAERERAERDARIILAYDLDNDIAPLDEPAAAWMAAASNRLRNVGDITWEEIRAQLVEGIKAGDGIPELAARVEQASGFAATRAVKTARTECAAAANGGSITQARALGLDMDKQWEATFPTDGRTRPTHLAAHHQTVPLDGKFVVGDSLLDFPADPTGEASEVIQCRCALTLVNIRRRADMPLTAAAVIHFVESEHPRGQGGKFARKAGHTDAWMAQVSGALRGAKALDSAPVQLTPDKEGHSGRYGNAELRGIDDDAVKLALSEMEGLEYQVTNDYLRNRGVRPSHVFGEEQIARWEQRDREGKPEVDARVSVIDKAMDSSVLGEDVVVHRGIKNGADTFGDTWYGEFITGTLKEQDEKWPRWEAGERPDLTGMVWEERAYTHTTVNDERLGGYARKVSSNDPVAMNILVPKGVKGVQLSGMDYEAEIMLERGLKYRVVKDHGTDENGVRRWDVEVIPND